VRQAQGLASCFSFNFAGIGGGADHLAILEFYFRARHIRLLIYRRGSVGPCLPNFTSISISSPITAAAAAQLIWVWEGISAEWIISYYQTKKGRRLHEYDLKIVQRLLGMLQETPKERRKVPS
jgi:hypothetical protein